MRKVAISDESSNPIDTTMNYLIPIWEIFSTWKSTKDLQQQQQQPKKQQQLCSEVTCNSTITTTTPEQQEDDGEADYDRILCNIDQMSTLVVLNDIGIYVHHYFSDDDVNSF